MGPVLLLADELPRSAAQRGEEMRSSPSLALSGRIFTHSETTSQSSQGLMNLVVVDRRRLRNSTP